MTDFALIPHAVYYLRPQVKDLVTRVIRGRGVFDYWESGMDMRFGGNMYDSFVRYQTRVIQTLDQLALKYEFVRVDATEPADVIFAELQRRIAALGLHTGKAKPPPTRIVTPLDHIDPATR